MRPAAVGSRPCPPRLEGRGFSRKTGEIGSGWNPLRPEQPLNVPHGLHPSQEVFLTQFRHQDQGLAYGTCLQQARCCDVFLEFLLGQLALNSHLGSFIAAIPALMLPRVVFSPETLPLTPCPRRDVRSPVRRTKGRDQVLLG